MFERKCHNLVISVTKETKQNHYILFHNGKEINQEDIVILNVYALSKRASEYMKQNLLVLKREIGKTIIIVGDCNPSLNNV